MTMTGQVRPMDDIGAGDIAVGQRWFRVVTEKARRFTWTVTEVTDDHATLVAAESTDPEVVSFGTLLSDWVLVAEAEA